MVRRAGKEFSERINDAASIARDDIFALGPIDARVEAAKARGSFTADHIREIDAKSGGRLGVSSNRLGSKRGRSSSRVGVSL
jgi:uncharacterized membrane protein